MSIGNWVFIGCVFCLLLEPLQAQEIIPRPVKKEVRPGYFELNRQTTLSLNTDSEEVLELVALMREQFQLPFPLSEQQENQSEIRLILSETLLEDEAYRLYISPEGVSLEAGSVAGLFYGVQSIWQMYKLSHLPACRIEDAPAFPYRGMHLDVSRHFYPVEFIKEYIDMLAHYKMNRFHWHLTDDQGWRIEIKRYPKLQEIAAYRKETLTGHYNDQPQRFDGQRYGGYYTQEEVKEIVDYARRRHITVIPEIEMPGHAQAALAAYPELACTAGPFETATKWGIFNDVYCPSEATFEFLENVLIEVFDLFPSSYIHVGGDECPKVRWKESDLAQSVIKREGLKNEHELQSYFIQRMERFVNAHGRKIIGWDEILEGGLAPNAAVMSWRGESGGIAAAQAGHEVVMTPTDFCYFDYYQSDHPEEPLAIGGFLPLEKVYHYHPVPDALSEEEANYILGAQGNVWSEYLPQPENVEYMAYARMMALSEVVWSGKDQKDFENFVGRLSKHLSFWRSKGVNVANHLFDVQANILSGDGKGVRLVLSKLAPEGEIRARLNQEAGRQIQGPLSIERSGKLFAETYYQGRPIGRSLELDFDLHAAAGKTISLEHLPADRYSAGGPEALINGLTGSEERYGDAEWLGFEGVDCIATIDLGKPQALAEVQFRFFNGPGQWIYPPKTVELAWSEDGNIYQPIANTSVTISNGKIASAKLEVPNYRKARFWRVAIPNYGIIPEGQQGGGYPAWLFVDELVFSTHDE